MFLIASSLNETTEEELNAKAKEFFLQNSVLNAQIFLNSLFDSKKIEVSASLAFTSALMHSSILWKDDLTPSGLASSVLSSQGVLRSNDLDKGIVLDYSTKFEMSSVLLEKLTKLQVIFPVDIHLMIKQLKGLNVLLVLFFGERSFLSQGLKILVEKFELNRQLLRVKLHLDKMFIAKILY